MNTSISSKQLIKFLELLEQRKMTPDRFQKLLESGLLSDLLVSNVDSVVRDNVRKALDLIPFNSPKTSKYIESTYVMFVVQNSLSKAIDDGCYDDTDSEINDSNFSLTNEVYCNKSMAIFHFNRNISSNSILKEMNDVGYRPATIMELLTLGKHRPDLQKQFTIVALGSRCQIFGNPNVPCLDEYGLSRRLGMYSWYGSWTAGYRFLAVLK